MAHCLRDANGKKLEMGLFIKRNTLFGKSEEPIYIFKKQKKSKIFYFVTPHSNQEVPDRIPSNYQDDLFPLTDPITTAKVYENESDRFRDYAMFVRNYFKN